MRRILHRLFRKEPQGATERVIGELSRMRRPVSFVQIGSNDADHGDPLRLYILKYGWQGKMVEPVPYVYKRLAQKYGQLPGIELLNFAVDDAPGERDFYYLSESTDQLPLWYDQLGSFLLENVLKHRNYIPDIDQRLRTMKVRCISVVDLVTPEVDLVHSDVEGYDHKIVASVLNSSIRPLVLIYEHIHLTPEDEKHTAANLREAGYRLALDGPNTICVRSDQTRLVKALGG